MLLNLLAVSLQLFPFPFFPIFSCIIVIESYLNCFPLTGSIFAVKNGKWLFCRKLFQDAYRKRKLETLSKSILSKLIKS